MLMLCTSLSSQVRRCVWGGGGGGRERAKEGESKT